MRTLSGRRVLGALLALSLASACDMDSTNKKNMRSGKDNYAEAKAALSFGSGAGSPVPVNNSQIPGPPPPIPSPFPLPLPLPFPIPIPPPGSASCWSAAHSGPAPITDVEGPWSVATGSHMLAVDVGALSLLYHTGFPRDLSSLGPDNENSKWGPWFFTSDASLVVRDGYFEYMGPDGVRETFRNKGAPDQPALSDLGTRAYILQQDGLIKLVSSTATLDFKASTYKHQSVVLPGGLTCTASNTSILGQTVAGAASCILRQEQRNMLVAVRDGLGRLIKTYERDAAGHLTGIRNAKGTLLAKIDWVGDLPYLVRTGADVAASGAGMRSYQLTWNWQGRPLLTKVAWTTAAGSATQEFTYDADLRLASWSVKEPGSSLKTGFTYAPIGTQANAPVALLHEVKSGTLRQVYSYGTPASLGITSTYPFVASVASYTVNPLVPDATVNRFLDSQCRIVSSVDAFKEETKYQRSSLPPYAITQVELPATSANPACVITTGLRGGIDSQTASDSLGSADCYGRIMLRNIDLASGMLFGEEDGDGNEVRNTYRPFDDADVNHRCGYMYTSDTYVPCPAFKPLLKAASYQYVSNGVDAAALGGWQSYDYGTFSGNLELTGVNDGGRRQWTYSNFTYAPAPAAPGAYNSYKVTSASGKVTTVGVDKWMAFNSVVASPFSLTISRNADGAPSSIKTQAYSSVLANYAADYNLPGRSLSGVTNGGQSLMRTTDGSTSSVNFQVSGSPLENRLDITTDAHNAPTGLSINGVQTMKQPIEYAPVPDNAP